MDAAEEWPASDDFSWQADIYEFRVELVEGCELPPPPAGSGKGGEKKGRKGKKGKQGGLNLMKPLKHKKCKNILSDAWKHCDNAGRGDRCRRGV